MKVAFACPSYGPIDPNIAHWQRFAIQMAWQNGLEVIADLSIDRLGWGRARNVVAEAAMKMKKDGSEIDGVFWCDSDTWLTGDAMLYLCRLDADIVTGIYYARRQPYEPQIHVFNKEKNAYNRIHIWEDGKPFPVNGCGFGCIYTSVRVLEAMREERIDPEDINKTESWWFRDNGPFGEDLDFCNRAEKKGFIIWCDPRVVVGHLGDPKPIGRSEFEAYMKDHPELCGEKPIVVSVRKRADAEGYEAVTEYLDPKKDEENVA